ncbi:hypothetical protein ACTXT7_012680, partial [Hymenolepis weldensis]
MVNLRFRQVARVDNSEEMLITSHVNGIPELEKMLDTGFNTPEDQKKAVEYVRESNGIGQTRMLAEFHFQEAQRQLGHFKASDARECLLQ